MKALDIETSGLSPHWDDHQLTALYSESEGASVTESLPETPQGDHVVHNTLFDLTFLHRNGVDISQAEWFDTMLMRRHLTNGFVMDGEQRPSASLAACVKEYLDDGEFKSDFLEMKSQPFTVGDKSDYWRQRAHWDAKATLEVFHKMMRVAEPGQLPAMIWEQRAQAPLAESWSRGINLDIDLLKNMLPGMEQEMRQIEEDLGLTPEQLASPVQLRKVMYQDWGLWDGGRKTPTMQPSTDAVTLSIISKQDARVVEVLRWKSLKTAVSKFINGALEYWDQRLCTTIYPQPRSSGTYTGRMTYSAHQDRGRKVRLGVPIHQWPRDKELRKAIRAIDEDHWLVEFDASGQEGRLMAEASQDAAMLQIFNKDMDFHGYMGAQIGGMEYEEFMRRKAAKDPKVVGAHGLRYCGKFINLACQYRIGDSALHTRAVAQYGLDVGLNEVAQWKRTYMATFPGVPQYWRSSVQWAKQDGYVETLAGRRYLVPEQWPLNREWALSSTAINFPIQGTGADMKYLAIASLYREFPELKMAFDMHDGLFFYLKKSAESEKVVGRALKFLNDLDYQDAWGWKPSIPILWEAQMGDNWGSMKGVSECLD